MRAKVGDRIKFSGDKSLVEEVRNKCGTIVGIKHSGKEPVYAEYLIFMEGGREDESEYMYKGIIYHWTVDKGSFEVLESAPEKELKIDLDTLYPEDD